MVTIFTKRVFLTFGFLWLMISVALAQTITISAIDAGPYGPGSSIAVPFSLNTASACASSTNVFNLYISDAAGNFSGVPKLIGSYSGFYGTFVNGVIPAGTPAGSNYKVKIICSDPAIPQAISTPFVITAATGVQAEASSTIINLNYPEVFGACIGKDNAQYTFLNKSTAGSVATASFYNEQTHAFEGPVLPLTATFTAKLANYTVFVRALAAGVVGTKAYTLINNPVNNSFGASGSTQVCLDGKNKLAYSIDVTSPNGIQRNYPGLIYNVTWGDGSSSNFTLCDIINSGGIIDHLYTKSSCGNIANNTANVFQINLLPVSPVCGSPVTAVTGYARVVSPPSNKIAGPRDVCTNVLTTFGNASIPGQDPNSATFDCTNQNALYTWKVDGVVVLQNAPLTQGLDYKFTTHGSHDITLILQNSAGDCVVEDKTITVCVQDAPKPSFKLSDNGAICTSGPLKVTNTSVTDEVCNPTTTYKWTVTGPKAITYGAGTNASSYEPTFVFSANGAYTVQLSITTPSCGEFVSTVQTVAVNLTPTVALSADARICGTNQTLTFGPTGTVTKAALNGTEVQQPDTYTWTVTGGAYSFANGTTANDRYPQILFTQYTTYTVNVVHKNNCGQTSKTQKLIFQESPIISSGGDQTICEGNSVTLQGSIPATGVNSYQWTGGAGTFSPSRNVQQPTYTPTAAEIAAGTVTLNLEAATNLPAPCNQLISSAVITITRKDNITSKAIADVCTGQNFTYNITSQNPASTYTWTTALTSGSATGFGATGSGATINDLINDTGTGDAVVTYTITPTTNGCPGNPFKLVLTINRVPDIKSPPDISTCTGSAAGIVITSSTTNTTYTWTSTVLTGTITGNTTQTVPTANAEIQDILTNSGTANGTVKYTITPYHGACQGTPIEVTVTVYPNAVIANAGPDDEVCSVPTYQLKGNNPSPGIGSWSLASGQTGVTFSNSADPNAVASGLQPGQVYKFVWSVSASATCPANSSTVTITTDVPTVAGTVTGSMPVCADANAGTLTLTGNTGDVLGWEFSTDGTTWAATSPANTTTTFNYNSLDVTTYYRAIVQNGNCSVERSAIATITVNQPVIVADAGADRPLCNATSVTLNGNNPSPFAGVWTQTAGPPVTIVDPSNPLTEVTGLQGNNTYRFLWTIKGLPPCADSKDEVEVVNAPDVIAEFKTDKDNSCGTYTAQFINLSAPSVAATVYRWDFGDGSPISNETNPKHTFLQKTDGRDTIYHVSLSILNNCFQRPPVIHDILVRPDVPVAKLFPGETNGCGSLVITAENKSPGNNEGYYWYLYNKTTGELVGGAPIYKPDKSPVEYPNLSPARPTKYELYLVAANCNTTGTSTAVTYTIAPATFVARAVPKDNFRKGCVPLTVTFTNVSTGGDSFRYLIFDAQTNAQVDAQPGLPGETNYTFTKAGSYYVKIEATNDCATVTSTDAIPYEVYPKPLPAFDANVKAGCKAIIVQFSNKTPANGASSANSLAYDWDFGDGTHSNAYIPLPHTYTSKNSPYTVKLTATNLVTGCNDVVIKTDFIKVSPAPNVDFTASPGFITKIPNYHFAFDDQTTGNPVSWLWDFGDGETSNGQNPGHTYADTGTYKVTLKVISRDGCDSTISHNVQITGTPGQLYMPNAFMPNSATSELRTFTIKGSGIESWHMQIFNNWGQLVWETTKLSSRGEPTESWDGMFKGAPAPQGVYVWQASAHFINGTEWKGMSYNNSLPKRTGVVHLIR